MANVFEEKTELVSDSEVPGDLHTSQESVLLEQFRDIDNVSLSDVVEAAKVRFDNISDIELRKLALKVYHIINVNKERLAVRQALLDPNAGLRAVTRRKMAASVHRLKNIGRASLPSEPPPTAS